MIEIKNSKEYRILDTEYLNNREAKEVIKVLKKLLIEIKNNNHKKNNAFENLFAFKYYELSTYQYDYQDVLKKDESIVSYYYYDQIINIEKFIRVKINELLINDFASSYKQFYDTDKIFYSHEDLLQTANLYIVRRIKNHFTIDFEIKGSTSENKKTINKILNYIKSATHSAVRHYFRDILNTELISFDKSYFSGSNDRYDLPFELQFDTYRKPIVSYNDEKLCNNIFTEKEYNPEEIMLDNENKKTLLSLINQLPETDKKIIFKNLIEGIKQKNIASELNISQQAVSKRLIKAKQFLKQNYFNLKN